MEILAFFAHPDDETILAGGTLALMSELGHNVHYLIATRGEGGECGDPPLCTRPELGKVREKETSAAVNALGGKSLTFLNYIDPVVGPQNELFSFVPEISPVLASLSQTIHQRNIEFLISHGSNGEYGHPAHLTVYSTVKEFFRLNSLNLIWYTSQAYYSASQKPHLANKEDKADWVLDVSSVFERKLKAAQSHATQHALFVRRKKDELKREVKLEEVIASEESFRLAGGSQDILREVFSNKGYLKSIIN